MDTSLINELKNIIDKSQKPWIKGKTNLAKWLGVSHTTVNSMLESGLPVHFIDNVDTYFFNKDEVTRFILSK